MTREHNPAMGPCDIPTPTPCLKCGRHTKYPGARCSDAAFCDGRSASSLFAAPPPSGAGEDTAIVEEEGTVDRSGVERAARELVVAGGGFVAFIGNGYNSAGHFPKNLTELSAAWNEFAALRAPAPVPEVREEDVAWCREGIKMLDETAARCVLTNAEYRLRHRLPRILAVLDALHARQRDGNG